MANRLKLYGVGGSQPYRACQWLLEMANIPYDAVHVMPGGKGEEPGKLGSRSNTYKKLVASGTVPALEDPANNLVIWESNAIMIYICEKHNLDLYPNDPKTRALINQWLHWHHGNSRLFTLALFAPLVRPDLQLTEEDVKKNTRQVRAVAKLMDDHLATNQFLVGDKPTIADIACYEDIGQCKAEFCNLYDFKDFKNLEAWTKRLEALPKFEPVHVPVLKMLGKFIQKQKSKI